MRDSGFNFAGMLVAQMGRDSCLADAARDERIGGLDLPATIRRVAHGLLDAGLQPGDRLLLACDISIPSSICYLAAMYSGVVPVPVETKLLDVSGAKIGEKARAKAIWRSRCSSDNLGLPLLSGLFPAHAELTRPFACGADDLAALMPTSGSTGMPRLVMVSHGNLRSNTEAIIRSQNFGTDERAMMIMPISYCFGASVLHTHLWQGGSVVFDSRFMFPDKVLHAVNSYRCTTFAGVPFVYKALLRRSNIRRILLPGLRRFLQAGGALDPESIREMTRIVPNAVFLVMYGQTEATARVSCLPPEYLNEKLGSGGVALDNLEVRIVDERDCQVQAGEVGEIQVRGPSVCRGYFADEEATQRKFAGGWLRTGDFASQDEDGFLWIKGRTDEFIKVRGLRLGIADVEARVAAVAGVSECAAVGVKHPEAGEAVAVLLVSKDDTKNTHSALCEQVKRALPARWTCATVKVVPELPRTANGKIARSQLQAML